jgi:hypothetical protein
LPSTTVEPTVKESIVHLSVALPFPRRDDGLLCNRQKSEALWSQVCSIVSFSPSSLVGYGRGLHRAPLRENLRLRLTDHKGCAGRVGPSQRAQSRFAWSVARCCRQSNEGRVPAGMTAEGVGVVGRSRLSTIDIAHYIRCHEPGGCGNGASNASVIP